MEIILTLLIKYSQSTFPQCNQKWSFWNQVIFFKLSPSLSITSKFPTISWGTLHFWERICTKLSLTTTRDISCAWNTNTWSYFLSPMKTAGEHSEGEVSSAMSSSALYICRHWKGTVLPQETPWEPGLSFLRLLAYTSSSLLTDTSILKRTSWAWSNILRSIERSHLRGYHISN